MVLPPFVSKWNEHASAAGYRVETIQGGTWLPEDVVHGLLTVGYEELMVLLDHDGLCKFQRDIRFGLRLSPGQEECLYRIIRWRLDEA
jgi:hypothetical protein